MKKSFYFLFISLFVFSMTLFSPVTAFASSDNPLHLPAKFDQGVPYPINLDLTAPQALADINYAHQNDGETDSPSPIVLPRNFYKLSASKQLFIISNLERTTRGMEPISGLSQVLNQRALIGAKNSTDPVLPSDRGLTNFMWYGNFALIFNPLYADYMFMYMDGYNGNTFKHAYSILNNWNINFPNTKKPVIEMGAASAKVSAPSYYNAYNIYSINSYTELFFSTATPSAQTKAFPMYFTWKQELPYFDRTHLLQGAVGKSYHMQLEGINGRAPYRFHFLKGTLPPGLSLLSNGEIVGTPTQPGTYKFRFQVTDSVGNVVALPLCALSVHS